ncbi:MAG: hypothetical protein ACI8P0_006548 [Planctomycetaceae bacterium]|jgi:hypothetical protein
MSEDDKEAKRKPWGCVIVIVASLPITYVLALGPAAWLHANSPPFIQNLLETVFMPLLLVLEAVGENAFVDSFLQPYAEWWGA